MDTYDVIIIGAGPAGLMCAVLAASHGLSVCVLEKNSSAGKKLLISGAGRCNITHAGSIDDFLICYGRQGRLLKPVLMGFNNSDLMQFFEKNGLPLIEKDNGKIFPASERAGDVLGVLLKACEEKKAHIEYNSTVNNIEYGHGAFNVSVGKGSWQAQSLVIATGGLSYPATGSTGDGYALARNMGHHVVGPAPALTPVIIKDYSYGECSGISLYDTAISLYRSNRKIGEHRGDVLFTGRGLSGPGILDMSRYILPDDLIALGLVPFASMYDFDKELIRAIESQGKRTLKNIITGYGVPERLCVRIFMNSSIPRDLKASQCSREQRQAIVRSCTSLPFTVESLAGYKEAMVTCGGVDLNEINMKTMESRLVRGLYFAGEIIDADGDTGGYNLQLAFSSGWAAAQAIAKTKSKE